MSGPSRPVAPAHVRPLRYDLHLPGEPMEYDHPLPLPEVRECADPCPLCSPHPAGQESPDPGSSPHSG